MVAARSPRLLTLREYLMIDRVAAAKSELVRGVMYAMTGGTLQHSRITANIIGVLREKLHGGACAVYDSNLRIWIAKADIATYPDASVICSDPHFAEDEPRDTVTNPSVVVEVLSRSTETYDRGDKLVAYQSCPSMKHCILVNPDPPSVEVFTRTAHGGWAVAGATELSASVVLVHLGIELPLAELFEGAGGT
ncbi:MAG: hypothetical protein A2138_14250 [Deltaproteobacteria bacterium RBG_16_71_12]|nr:MAG: hypothetical protein A2138_14250 [Deltaproteobacteria bacterium RBG_16_71_12]